MGGSGGLRSEPGRGSRPLPAKSPHRTYITTNTAKDTRRAPWKGCWSPAGESPVREVDIAPGSSRDSREGDRTAEAFDGKGRISGSASMQAVTTVNAGKAPKTLIRKPAQRRDGEGRRHRIAKPESKPANVKDPRVPPG